MIFKKTHVYTCDVSFDLLDAGSAVYHPNYLILCDRARSVALQQAGYSVHDLWKDGWALAVRQNTSEYYKPILMGMRISILTTTEEATGTSLYVKQRIVSTDWLEERTSGSLFTFLDTDIEVDPKSIIHQVKLHLVCIQHQVFKAARLPQRLIHSLQL